MTVQVGTSGFHYKHWRNRFYPQDLPSSKWLDYYCRHFGSVEINNSFYRLPEAKTLQTWRETTPEQFVFAVKGSRFLTHMKKLKDPEPGIERFFERIFTLEPKLGPVLFQLPPFWEKNAERLEVFLRALPQGLRYSFEFRNPTWHVPEIYGILHAHNAAFCPFDLGGFQSPVEIRQTGHISGCTGRAASTRARIRTRRSDPGPAGSRMAAESPRHLFLFRQRHGRIRGGQRRHASTHG